MQWPPCRRKTSWCVTKGLAFGLNSVSQHTPDDQLAQPPIGTLSHWHKLQLARHPTGTTSHGCCIVSLQDMSACLSCQDLRLLHTCRSYCQDLPLFLMDSPVACSLSRPCMVSDGESMHEGTIPSVTTGACLLKPYNSPVLHMLVYC